MNARADVGIVTVVTAELNAVFRIFGIDHDRNHLKRNGTNYWFHQVRLSETQDPLSIALAVLNAASGNTEAAITTTLLIRDWNPRLVFLCGIAAGREGKVKVGDVVVAERIHDITIKTLRGGVFRPRTESRSRHRKINEMLKLRVARPAKVQQLSNNFPPASKEIASAAKAARLSNDLIGYQVTIHDGSIVSDNTLLRDDSFFTKFADYVDEKCRAGEMESAGFSRASELHDVPWIVVRGISDFGDNRKDDSFHQLAAIRAASTLRVLATDVIDLSLLERSNLSKEWAPGEASLELEVERAFNANKWDTVVELGRLLSRPLWLAGRLRQRVRIGKFVEEAAARLQYHRARAASLVDDIGWTTVALGDSDGGEVFIRDGYGLAKNAECFDLASKAARHLASISRRKGDATQALQWLDTSEELCSQVPDASVRFELENRLKLSRAKAKASLGSYADAIREVGEARKAFEDPERGLRIRYAESFLIEAEIRIAQNDLDGAITAAGIGYRESSRYGRRDEALANAFFLEALLFDRKQLLEAKKWGRRAIALATEIDFPVPQGVLRRSVDDGECEAT